MCPKIMNKPYAESCDRNRDPIFEVIQPLLSDKQSVLEIGSGTGQHAIYFAPRMPHLSWITSERQENLAGIHLWLDEAGDIGNIQGPIELDVSAFQWHAFDEVDAIFSANTAHIMHWDNVVDFFAGAGQVLRAGGVLLLYGPFNFDGEFSSDSNRQFDGRLREGDPLKGIRDFEALDALANEADMECVANYVMPANNHILHWQKKDSR